MTLRSLHPELDVEVVEAEDPLSTLGHAFDLMLHFGRPPNREGWFSHVVIRIPVGLRASPSYLETHSTPTSLDELDNHPLLQWSAPGLDHTGLPLRGGGTLSISPWVRSANIMLLNELAQADAGIIYAPIPPPGFSPAADTLVPVLDDVVGTEINLRALTPRPSRADPKIRAILENLQRLLEGLATVHSPPKS